MLHYKIVEDKLRMDDLQSMDFGTLEIFGKAIQNRHSQGRRYWGVWGGVTPPPPPNNFKLEKLVKLEKKLVKIYNWSLLS